MVPLLSISVFAVLDQPVGLLLRERFGTVRTVHLTTAGRLREAGFELFPTGLRPHFTVRLHTADDGEPQHMVAALGQG